MPDSLFMFCPVNNPERKSWIERVLIQNQIYFRNREQLNDPHELRPQVVFEGSDKQIRAYARRLWREGSPQLSPAKRLLEEATFARRLRNAPSTFEKTLHELLDRIGLLCLSESSEQPLLWAHYADGHRGVCVQFDAAIGLFHVAQQVTYTDDVPLVNRLTDSNEEILRKSMFTKGADWAYEREWRVIARWHDEERIENQLVQHSFPESVRSFMRSQHGSGYYSFPPEALRSIILGSRIDPAVERWLREILEKGRPDVAIRKK